MEDNTKKPEEITSDKLLKQMEKEKKQIKTRLFFAVAALIAIIALGIAWFVSNNRVKSNTSKISADDENPFWLASVGERQQAEEDYLKDEKGNKLSEGTPQKYDSYIDIKTGKSVSTNETTYHTGISGLAWRMNGQQSFSPGSSGKLEFYIIPKMNNLKSATITLDITGYYKPENSNRADKKNDENLQNLLSGHILLFQNLDDTYGYTGWLGESNTLTVNVPKAGNSGETTFQKNVPYKITLYWVWPKYFRNYIYTQRSTQEDLFTDKIDQSDGSEYQKLIQFMNKYKKINSENNENKGKFFFSTEATGETNSIGNIDNKMSDVVLDACSKYYNQADEYIGNNLDYIYVEMKVE